MLWSASILNYSESKNPYFYQIYRTNIAVVSGVSTISDIAIITEFKQIEESFPTQEQLNVGVVEFIDKTPEGEVLDKLGFNKMCCRRHLLTHVDIE